MRIPDSVKKSVVFIGIETKTEFSAKIDYRGTGFIVSIPSERNPASTFPYLVTAKHVLVGINGRDYCLRANKKDGDTIIFRVNNEVRWWFHPNEDESSDVAVLPLAIPQTVYDTMDCVMIPVEMLLTDETCRKEEIGEGDEVFIIGLFSYLSGDRKNIPIVRTGNIAMMPDEPVHTSSFGNMEAYLIEARSTGGMSGSPVIVTKDIEIGRKKMHLLGLIHGHWDIPQEQILKSASADFGTGSGVNLGIAIVAPAKKILETIYRDELVAQRSAIEARRIANKSKPES